MNEGKIRLINALASAIENEFNFSIGQYPYHFRSLKALGPTLNRQINLPKLIALGDEERINTARINIDAKILLKTIRDSLDSNYNRLRESSPDATYLLRHGPRLLHRHKVALQTLYDHPSVSIVTADKNMGFVIVDDSWLRAGVKLQLDDPSKYDRLSPNTGQQILNNSVARFLILIKQLKLDDSDRAVNLKFGIKLKTAFKMNLPKTGDNVQPCSIKPLAKIHKIVGVDGTLLPKHMRIITQAHRSPFQPFFYWFACLLQPMVVKLVKSYLRDSTHLILLLQSLQLQHDKVYTFITADASNLYGNLPLRLVRNGVKMALQELHREHQIIAENTIDQLLKLIELTNSNCFVNFEGYWYRQRLGIAMGRADGVQLANLALGVKEQRFLEEDPNAFFFFKRYIDDVFCIFQGPINEAKKAWNRFVACSELEWNAEFVEFQPNFRASSLPSSRATFLDLHIWRNGRNIDTAIHVKETNLRLYIPPSSLHPSHVAKGWISSEVTRIARNCSNVADFYRERVALFWALRGRAYPARFLHHLLYRKDFLTLRRESLSKAARKLSESDWPALIESIDFDHDQRFFFVIPWHPLTAAFNWSRHLNQIWRQAVEEYNEERREYIGSDYTALSIKPRFSTAWKSLPSLSFHVDRALSRTIRGIISAPALNTLIPNTLIPNSEWGGADIRSFFTPVRSSLANNDHALCALADQA
jgi:hypothetical protein